MSIEKKYVQEVYDRIATEFSDTRYRTWTCTEDFLDNIPEGSKVADIGCGNGKAMLYKKNVLWEGCDNSKNLVKICEDRGLNVRTGDILNIPFQNDKYDYTICVAVIHHLSCIEKRMKAVEELVRITKPGGEIFILCWSMEQPPDSRRKFLEQDNYIPFCDKSKRVLGKRFYHVFQAKELESLLPKNVEIVKSIYECGNYGVIIKKL
jgi:ubiquinone/menaquinone biosynthesis C-methylase UbiE